MQGSGAHRHLGEMGRGGGDEEGSAAPTDLSSVGLVVWQSAFLLAELLLQHPPLGPWADVRTFDLGSGTGAARDGTIAFAMPHAQQQETRWCMPGVVGIALALAGADALLVDLPHITPLTRANVDANCASPLVRAQACPVVALQASRHSHTGIAAQQDMLHRWQTTPGAPMSQNWVRCRT